MLDAAREQPLVGVYAIGAGNRGLIRAIKTLDPKPVTIVHELTPTSREALRNGTFDLVIDQNIRAGVVAAVKIMRDLTENATPPADAGKIKLNIYSRENIQ